jgi:hypothetical protein
MSQEDLVAKVLSDQFSKVRNNLDNLKSMLQDLVLAVPQMPDAEKLARAVLASLPEPEPAAVPEPVLEPEPAPAPPAAPPAPALNNLLLYHAACIEYAAGQAEVLNALLKGVEQYAQRGVLFVVRNETAQAWNAFGFEKPEEAKRWRATMDKDPILTTVVNSRSRMLLDNAQPGFIPDDSPVRRSLISPLLLKGKVLAFLYADSGADGKLDHYSIDLLMRVASLAIDIFPLRPKRDPLPPVLENQDIILPQSAPLPAQQEDASLLFEDTGTLSSTTREPEELPTAQTVMAEIPQEAVARPSRAPDVQPVELESGDYVRPVEPAEPEEAEVVAEEPPPPEEPAEEPIPPGEERLHSDAERFAKLLVQEIALYHPKEMEQGRRQSNLYALLRDDIERSREAFENRFQKPSIRSRDYFGKALVKYLANGEPSLLGK